MTKHLMSSEWARVRARVRVRVRVRVQNVMTKHQVLEEYCCYCYYSPLTRS